MEEIGIINNRKIFFQQYSTERPWSKGLPTVNWLAFIVASNQGKTKLYEITNKVIVNDACFVCCAGEQGKALHDIFDDDIVFRQVDPDVYCPAFDIVTTWHESIENGLWYAIYCADNSPLSLNKILCLNAGGAMSENSLIDLVSRFKSGYIPD